MKKLLAILSLIALPGLAAAQSQYLPAVDLDNPELGDFAFGNSYRGVVGEVKGEPNGTDQGEWIGNLGASIGRDGPDRIYYGFPALLSKDASSWLVPSWAKGAVGVRTSPTFLVGPFVQAIIYEPDRVKRTKGFQTKGKATLKQNSWVAVRWGIFSGDSRTSAISGAARYEACKASFDLKFSPQKTPPAQARMKFKCSGNDPATKEIKDVLEGLFAKRTSGFEVRASGYFD